MTKKEKTNLNMVLKEVGLNPIVCSCGEKINGKKAMDNFFQRIIAICKNGGEVMIGNFGVFYGKVQLCRTLKESPGQEVEFEERMILKFRRSKVCKMEMNRKED